MATTKAQLQPRLTYVMHFTSQAGGQANQQNPLRPRDFKEQRFLALLYPPA